MPLRLRWGAWLLAGLAASVSLLGELVGSLWQPTVLPSGIWPPIYAVVLPLFTLSFALVGSLIVSRHSKNVIGWLCLAIALVTSTYALIVRYSLVAEFNTAASLPGGLWTTWVVQWGWIPLDSLLFVFLPALFPTGKLASRRWRVIIWLAIPAAGVTMLAAALYPVMSLWTAGPSCVWSSAIPGPCYRYNNPFPLTLSTSVLDIVFRLSGGLQSVTILLATLSLVARYRRGSREIRAQLKWLTTAGGLLFLSSASLFVLGTMAHLTVPAAWLIAIATIILLPFAIAFAILKHRLYDIDIVINKTLLFGAMAAFITAVYVGIVVGIGDLVGTGGRPNLGLSILATALVAVAFQPVRERVQRVANRLVYGKRASPYEVLSQFSQRVADVYSSEDVLPQMASVVGEGTGASRADVWIRLGDAIAPAASWPMGGGPPPPPVEIIGPLPTSVPGVSRIVPVQHQGELLGAVSINKRPGETLTPVEEKLLADLAAQAGLVLRNVHLTTELQTRLTEISRQAVELRASRQRIVAAQDAERRRLERNIHDGAQQNLVALAVKLRLATNLAKRDPERARDSVKALEDESDQALATLRALARGIYPPLLREQGLVAAVRAESEKMAVPAKVAAEDVDRYSPDVEAAVYFVCLEALQNVTKHAKASHVQITLRSRQTALSFDIADDGTGFDVTKDAKGSGLRNMTDRIDAMGGRLEIRSAAQGTTVSGVVPIRAMERVG
jgi:signal transduction histidine kinase